MIVTDNAMGNAGLTHPVYIDDNETLRKYCLQWQHATVLALDTEFIRTDTFYPIGALIQVSEGTACFLIDPLSIDDFTPFTKLLTDPGIVKVLHSCSEDLEVFERLFQVLPQPLIDTQIAAGLDGYGFSIGYQKMTESLLQIHVPKGETRSNWLQRPLTESQIHYAALDVAYLPEMYHRLQQSLELKGRWQWLLDDCAQLTRGQNDSDAVSQYYKKVKSVWKLSVRQLGVLRCVVEWRESEARERDRPRGRIVKDKSCFDIARLQPRDIKSLSAIEEVGPKTIRNYGTVLLNLVASGQSLPASALPEQLPKPLPPQAGSLLKQLKAHVNHRAEHLQMAPELLVRKRDYEALLRSGAGDQDYQLPESLCGWRKEVIGKDLLDIVIKQSN